MGDNLLYYIIGGVAAAILGGVALWNMVDRRRENQSARVEQERIAEGERQGAERRRFMLARLAAQFDDV
mgnify:CR=1 FL=1